ncbi:carbonate dehydratase [Rhodanobacter sp. 115]|nr:carbonate dehydratase [Rhodanobacter sp. 115]
MVQAGGFREAARKSGRSASSLSEAVRRLETRLGVRLLNRSTRSVMPTEAGTRLVERLVPALGEVEASLDVVNGFRDRPARASCHRHAVPQSLSRHPAGSDRGRQFRGHAGVGLRCRHSL